MTGVLLTLQSAEPVTVALPGGATITLAAPSPRIVAAGRAAVRRVVMDDADLPVDMMTLAFGEGVLRAAIAGWDGIGGADGEPLPCIPDTISAALADPMLFDALERAYVVPIGQRDAEKNASAVSPDGTSGRATADKTTAGSPAATKPRSGTKKAKA